MSDISDDFTTHESQRLQKIKQQYESTEGTSYEKSGLETDMTAGNALLVGGLINFFLPTLGGFLGSKGLTALAQHLAPQHPGLATVSDLVGGTAGAIAGDPAAWSGVSGEELDKIKQILTSPDTQGELTILKNEGTDRMYKILEKQLNAAGKKEVDAKVGVFQKTFGKTGNAYTAMYNAQLANPKITAEKVMTDAINLPVQQMYQSIGVAGKHGTAAGAKAFVSAMYAYKESFKEAMGYGFTSFKEDRPAFMEAMGLGSSEESSYALENYDNSQAAFAHRWLNSVARITSVGRSSVMASDQFSKAIAYRANLRLNAYVEALDTAESHGLVGAAKNQFAEAYSEHLINANGDALHDKALQKTFEHTFTDTDAITKGVSQFTHQIPLLRTLVPYFRTPYNLVKEGLYQSPFAPLASTFWKDIGSGDDLRQGTALAKWGAGSAMYAWIADETMKGNITGDGPQGLGKEFWPGKGHPRSVKIGDDFFSHTHLGPYSETLSLAADSVEMYHHSKDPEVQQKILDTMGNVMAKNMEHLPFMEAMFNVSHAIDSIKEGQSAKAAKEFLGRTVSGFIPAPVRLTAQIMDPQLRDAKTVLDSVKESIPYYSKSVPPERDGWGHYKYISWSADDQLSPIGRALNSMNPIPYEGKNSKPDVVDRELFKHGISFKQIPEYISKMGDDAVAINPVQQDEWKQKTGHGLTIPIEGKDLNQHDFMDHMINQDFYKTASPLLQHHILTSIHDSFHEAGKGFLFQKYPELGTQIQQNAVKAISSPAGPSPNQVNP